MNCCCSCQYFEGSKNPFVMGFCDMKQVPVMPRCPAEDCPYFTFDDDNDW